MGDSIHKILTSTRLTVISAIVALQRGRLGEEERLKEDLLKKARAYLVAARGEAEETGNYLLAADIDELQYELFIMLEGQHIVVAPQLVAESVPD